MSLLRLNQHGGKFLVVAYGAIRRTPVDPSSWQVACTVVSVEGVNVRPQILWIPVNEIGRYPIGALVGRRPGKVTTNYRKIRCENVEYYGTSEHSDEDLEYAVSLYQPREDHIIPWDQCGITLLYNNKAMGFIISPEEVFRFYCGSVSLLAEPLLNAISTADGALDQIVNPRETGWDRNTFVLAPRHSFCGPSSVLQLALALSDDEVKAMLVHIFNQIKNQLRTSDISALTMIPKGPLDLKVRAEEIEISVGGQELRPMLAVRQILADHRMPTFKELVVRYPFSSGINDEDGEGDRNGDDGDDGQGEGDGDEGGKRKKRRMTRRTKFTGREFPGPGTFRVDAVAGRFSTCFPAWRGRTVRYDYKERKPGPPRQRPSPNGTSDRSEAQTASTQQKQKGGTLNRVMSAPTGDALFLGEQSVSPRVPSAFIPENINDQLRPIIVQSSEISELMQTFFEAGKELLNWQMEDYSPNIVGGPSDVLMYELPPKWGGIANRSADGRIRRIGALPLLFDNGLVWAVEIERWERPEDVGQPASQRRNTREMFALGLVAAQRDVADDLAVLGGAVCGVCNRPVRKRKGEPPGTWPTAEFTDIRMSSVAHTRDRLHPSNLASAILERCRRLLLPSINP